jgi:hypothetical protein
MARMYSECFEFLRRGTSVLTMLMMGLMFGVL